MLKSSLCDYNGAYILVKERIKITGERDNTGARQANERNKGVTLQNGAPFTDWISKTNNTQVNNVNYLDIVMPVYELIEYSDNYPKTSGSLWQYYRDGPHDNFTDSESFKSKIKIAGNAPADGNTKDVEISVPLKYLGNFWKTLEMSLINCEINLILKWS